MKRDIWVTEERCLNDNPNECDSHAEHVITVVEVLGCRLAWDPTWGQLVVLDETGSQTWYLFPEGGTPDTEDLIAGCQELDTASQHAYAVSLGG